MDIKDIVTQNGGKIIYHYIRGSHAYGLNVETSDIDTSMIYIAPYSEIIGLRSNYKEQLSDEKGDNIAYEVGRYLELLLKSNPTQLESLFIPERCILYKDPVMDLILEHKNDFLSKSALYALSGYAWDQIQKAQGLNKKCVNPVTEKPTPIEYCKTFKEQGSESIESFLEANGLKQKYCGLVHIPKMDQVYGVYYDWGQHIHNEWKTEGEFLDWYHYYLVNGKLKFIESFVKWGVKSYPGLKIGDIYNTVLPLGYRGIQKENGSSNEIRVDSVKKGEEPICWMSYNENGYKSQCKRYKEYQDWLKNRNEERYQNNLGHNYDSKNMMHNVRLLTMALELARDKKYIIDRSIAGDREYLLDIRNHKFSYQQLLDKSNELKSQLDQIIKTCDLPDKVDYNMVNNLLIQIRNKFYE